MRSLPARRGSARRDATREAVLAAALRCFARDGYRRTALDRVAAEAGISRAALYLHFANKEALFRALVGDLHAQTLAAAARAARHPGDLAARLTAVLAAKSGRFFDLLRSSEHAEEFLDENHRLCGDLSGRAAAVHARLIARILAAAATAGDISLSGAGLSAPQAAELLLATADGIKARGRTTLSAREYERRLGLAVRVVIAGLARPAPTGRRGRRARSRASPSTSAGRPAAVHPIALELDAEQ
jgi:AcrR family transcriptional regulator